MFPGSFDFFINFIGSFAFHISLKIVPSIFVVFRSAGYELEIVFEVFRTFRFMFLRLMLRS